MNEQEHRIINIAKDKGIIIRNTMLQARSGGKTLRQGFEMGVHFTLNNLWISVDERLPYSPDLQILVHVIDVTTGKQMGDMITHKTLDGFDRIYLPYKVTHWMPIPSVTEGETKWKP